jgi:predicted membrane chloride channel (bestrophin family)
VSIGAAIFITAVGAILRYAVNDSINGVDLETVGLILMVAGIVGLVLSLFLEFGRRGRADRYVEVRDERDPVDPPRY